MNKKVCLLVLAGLLCSRGLLAEETTKSFTGSELVVTSSRVEEEKKNVTTNITVISKEEIKQSSAKDLGDLLAEKNLGTVHKYPGTLTSIGIRGFRTESHGNDLQGKVLVLLNGRRAGTGNLAKIAVGEIDRIEIIHGPAAVQYGTAAIGGVINVITARGSGEPGLFFAQELGSSDYTRTTLGTSGKIGNLDFSGSVSLSEMGDYKTGSGKTYYNTAYDDQTSGSLNIGYEFTPGHRVGVNYTYFNVGDGGSPYYLSQNDLDDWFEKENYSTDIVYEGRTADSRLSWMARYFTGRDYDVQYDPTGSNQGWDDDIPYTSKVDHKGAQAQLTYNYDYFRATAGIDWLNYEETTTPYAPYKSEYDNMAEFLLLNGFLFDKRLVLSAGFRYDTYDLTSQGYEDSSESDRDDDNFVMNYGVAWHVTDGIKLRASYAEGFKMPASKELAADYYISTTHYVGNADLKPEESTTCEIGVDVADNRFASSLTWFTTDFKNKIQSVSLGSGVSSWENLYGAKISGFEGEVSYAFEPFGNNWQFSPYASFVYLTEFEDDGTGDRLLYTPEWNATVGLRVNDQRGFSGMFNLAYTGESDIQDWETSWAGTVITKGGFAVANLTASKKFMLSEKKSGRALTIKGEVNNLFDRDYEFVKGYPMPGRSFAVGVRVDI
ncbi:TonB-dependent receptor [Chlorobium limicola DSM 245]|uniref:TonB-dependent receptor n=1 Tax=Chlorobium limicola (strain DSM 245 / NBRC 103803 / 6330) TaxID=290315 RepID=B3EC58_CHLL2|nr:TonB-dependent receptor [Chlorobium limicola]ACD90133.1 TonB-dependent receptor [Chlorobium limicola DSM 245]